MGIKIPWQVFACAGLVILLALSHCSVYNMGKANTQAKWDASIERGRSIVEGLKANQGKVTTQIEYKYIDRWRTIHEKGDTITKLVPHYIPVDSCELPGGFRVLHDAAVTGTIPGTAEGTDAAPVPAATAATTVSENYTQCRGAISDLQGLREWVEKQRQTYLDLCKQQEVDCTEGS